MITLVFLLHSDGYCDIIIIFFYAYLSCTEVENKVNYEMILNCVLDTIMCFSSIKNIIFIVKKLPHCRHWGGRARGAGACDTH